MFEKKYKNVMNKVTVDEEALNNAIKNATARPKSMNVIKIALIACISVAIICTSVFAAFKLSESEKQPNNLLVSDLAQSSNPNHTNDIPISLQGFNYATSYEDVYQSFINSNELIFSETTGEQEVEEDAGEIVPDSPPKGEDTPEFSNTNNQVLGVQEGDVVKTDGGYIYHLSKSKNKVYIISAKDGITNVASEISLSSVSNGTSIFELLLIQNHLVIIGDNYVLNETICIYYDITDRNQPVKSDETTQSGSYSDCRVVDGIVYTISQKYSYLYSDSEEDNNVDYEEIIPEINGELIGCGELLISDNPSRTFTVITAYDAVNNKHKSSLALLGACRTVYCSAKNIYLIANIFNGPISENEIKVYESSTNSKILRISLNQGDIIANGSTCINGTINNQFSLDEKDGLLRVAATISPVTYTYNGDFVSTKREDSYSKVYCLDTELKVIGESEALGITETIKSVRFLGDIAYVVTFRQTDPLYAIDLSDPKSPKTLSELKIKGFSTYMQSYGSDYMLGIGHEATLEGAVNGIKLTMFDISEPANVFDVSTVSFLWGDDNAYTDALWNHKAVLIDHKKGLIGIPFILDIPVNTDDWHYEYKQVLEYKLFNFDGKELTVGESIEIPTKDGTKYWYGTEMRSLYIGDYLYVAYDGGLVSVGLSDYNIVNTINY